MVICLMMMLLGSAQSQSTAMVRNTTGSVDKGGVCHCTMTQPDSTFPADRLEYLETYNHNLSVSVEQEIAKIRSYGLTVSGYLTKLKNLTTRVEKVENTGPYSTEMDFKLLKLEIAEMEALSVELKRSINGSNVIVEALYGEIHNISVLVHQMESYDKNNVLAIRREIAALQKRLEECQKNDNSSHPPPPPPVKYGTCEHGGLVNISKAFVVHINFMGALFKTGGWGKDSGLGGGSGYYFVAPLFTDGRTMRSFRTYSSYDNLVLYNHQADKTLSSESDYGQGTGVILYNDFLYYNCYNSRDLCKLNPDTDEVTRMTLTDAAYNNRFSYALSTYEDINLAADEDGFWVIYSNEQNVGKFMISKLNETSFTITETWTTSQYKPAASNAFMVCGVLYATRPLNTQTEEIFYMYDTKTGKERYLSIPFTKMKENVQSLSYNPNDHKLYMYNDGFLVMHDLTFKPKKSDIME